MNQHDSRQTRRRSMRHPSYDYSIPGSYFVTICVQDRRCLFGRIEEGQVLLSPAGQQAETCIWDLKGRFPTILLDCFVVMPNHVHAVIMLGGRPLAESGEGAMNRAATEDLGSRQLKEPKLGDVVRVSKATSTRAIRTGVDATFTWQSDYHDRIIRTDRELVAIRDYVQFNSLRWAEDTLNDRALATP